MSVWAAITAAVRVSRPQNVCAPWRAKLHLVSDLFEAGLDPGARSGRCACPDCCPGASWANASQGRSQPLAGMSAPVAGTPSQDVWPWLAGQDCISDRHRCPAPAGARRAAAAWRLA